MNKSALLETLSVFTALELTEFHKFVHSPFFNDGPHAVHCTTLWECLWPYAPTFDHADLRAERVYAKIFPGKTIVKGKLDVVMSKLHQLTKTFAAIKAQEEHPDQEAVRLASFFRQRSLYHRAAPILEKMRTELAQNPLHDERYWRQSFQVCHEQHLLDTSLQNRHEHESLAGEVGSLLYLHLVQSLDLLNALYCARRKNNLSDSLADTLAASILPTLQVADLEQEPLLRLLKTALDFARQPEQYGQTELLHFWRDLEAHAHLLPDKAQRNLFTYARRHCTWHFNHGHPEFAPLNLILFKSCFERGLLFEHGKIQASTYLNMVQAGLIARDFEWLKNVMPQCRDHIIGVPQPMAFYGYTLANLHYHLGEHDRALDLLLEGSDDLFNTLMARKLELKIYYETSHALLDSKMDNFKLFVFRQGKKNLTEDVFLMNNHFIDALRSMVNAFGNSAKAQKLLEKWEATPLLAERAWLREQLGKLAAGR